MIIYRAKNFNDVEKEQEITCSRLENILNFLILQNSIFLMSKLIKIYLLLFEKRNHLIIIIEYILLLEEL